MRASSAGSSERGLIVISSQLHEHLQQQHSATNCLPHGELGVPKAKEPLPRAKKLLRGRSGAAKTGLNSKLRAVCDGALRRSGGLQRLSLAFAIILAERSHLDSFRSLACDEVVRAPTDPDPLDLDCGPSFRQGHCPPAQP
jgi:hypothetical protein